MAISNLPKVVVNRDTGLFLKGEDWTSEREEATRFNDFTGLFRACEQVEEGNLDLLLLLDDPQFDVRIPFRRRTQNGM